MARDIIDFLPRVAAAAPFCPTTVILDKIIEALRLFCHESKLWVYQLESQSFIKDQRGYDIPTMNELNSGNPLNTLAEVVAIDHVEINERSIETISEAYLNEMERSWRVYSEPEPRRFYMGPERTIQFVYKPSQATTSNVDIWVSVKPLWTATQVEDWFYNDWRRAIEYASQALCMEIPQQPWTDLQMALGYWEKFNEQLDDAHDHKQAGYGDHSASYYWRPDRRYV